RAINFFTPHKVSLAASLRPRDGITLHAQVDWLGWSRFAGALADLKVTANLGVVPSLVEATLPQPRFRDASVPRFGSEFEGALNEHLTLLGRLGYAFEPSPVPNQRGLTNFADADRHVASFGGGVELRELTHVLPKPLRVDVALQLHELATRFTA